MGRKAGMEANRQEDILAAVLLPVGTALSVVTYREGDPMAALTLAFYEAIGFAPAEELPTFDCSCQRLTRHRAGRAAGQIKSRGKIE